MKTNKYPWILLTEWGNGWNSQSELATYVRCILAKWIGGTSVSKPALYKARSTSCFLRSIVKSGPYYRLFYSDCQNTLVSLNFPSNHGLHSSFINYSFWHSQLPFSVQHSFKQCSLAIVASFLLTVYISLARHGLNSSLVRSWRGSWIIWRRFW